jgi:hypothetical protein
VAVRNQVRNQTRARVLHRLPEHRRFGAGGAPGMLTMALLALVLFLGGLVVGRATMTRDPAAGTAPGTTAAGAGATVAPSTAAPAPETAAQAPPAGAAVNPVGPRRVVHGVGVGYAHTREGAAAAAANYTKALSGGLLLDDDRRQQAIDTLAAPQARARLQKTFAQAAASLRKGLGVSGAGDGSQVLLRATPVGWRMERYDQATARVAIWVTSVAGAVGGAQGSVPIREGWGITTVDLRWVKGDWKQLASTTVDGMVPIADVSPPTAAAELLDEAANFKEFTYAPGS